MHFLIVRRGKDQKFSLLQNAFARHPVEIFWDRRIGERRKRIAAASAELRTGSDRRRQVPDTWADLDFILASPQQPDPIRRVE